MNSSDICLASFPFGDAPGMKLRPVLLLTAEMGPIPEVLVAYISSVVPNQLLATDILLDPSVAEQASTNLKTRSLLRLHKLATIHGRMIVRHLGSIDADTKRIVADRLRRLLSL